MKKYLLKHRRYSKDRVAKEELYKCVESFSNFSDLESNGYYVLYQQKFI